ncbi:MAG: hypothetical protein FJW36_19250 [Acidobacteria bacterium]|nr:hypothetical protein [Acidobacteriota bacterium]
MTYARNVMNEALELSSLGKYSEAIDFLKSELYWDLRPAGQLRIIVRFLCATLEATNRNTEAVAIMEKLDYMHLAEASDLFFLWKAYSKTSRVEQARDYLNRCRSLCKSEENQAIEILLDDQES